jgi:uncharacterized damage-inducible protein DinB
MNSAEQKTLREQLLTAITGRESHTEFHSVVKDFPPDLRGKKPAGAPHTAWQLLEHMRIAQHDILEFSRNSKHQSPKWPEGYWPKTEAPPDQHAWAESVRQFDKDTKEMNQLIETGDLFTPLAHGDGQTLLREALVLANHNSYHLGQVAFLKKMLAGKI